MEAKTYIDKLIDFAWNYGPKFLMAIIILFAGLWVIRRITQAFESFLKARKVDDSLRPFFVSLNDVGMKVVLLLVVASMVGLETTSFIAIFSAIAFSVGLALQGSLGNFASGVLILLFRPYKVGDRLTVAGLSGVVAEIQIFNTILHTQQGKRIIIPNGKMTEGPIENILDKAEIQVEVSLLVNSQTSLEALRAAAQEVVENWQYTLKGTSAHVTIKGITRDDMKAEIGCWVMGEHYEETLGYMFEALKAACDKHGVELAKERRKELV
ncbi:MAG: mechanosensitive ion channel domain-containing protein [Bacteroidota bacterium]